MVVKGKCDPDLPFFTVGGSFWINGALRLEESGFPEVCPSRHIGRCAARRYESIAAIPLKNGKEIIGLLQLCDSHGDAFAEDLIEFFEGIGASIGIALGRRQSREALRIKDLAIDTSLNAMAIASPEGILTYANPAFVRLFEYENEAEIIGKSAQSFWEDRNLAKKAAKEILNKQSWEGNVKAITRKGKNIEAYFSANSVLDAEGNVICMVASVIEETRLKSLQERLIRSERLAATGQLAVSIAHEINSPLQSIAILLGNMRRKIPPESDLAENVGLIREGFDLIKGTVQKMLDLNRPASDEKSPCDLNVIIKQVVALTNSQLKSKGIETTLDLDPQLPHIRGAGRQFGQVFVNLIINAMESMSERDPIAPNENGGNGAVKKEIRLATKAHSQSIVATVEDTGPGIPGDCLQKIFDPFFTRKKGKGMGIGLSICQEIIEDHDGAIAAANAEEGGARFTITLPLKGTSS